MIKTRLKALWELPYRYLFVAGFGAGLLWSSFAFTSFIWALIGASAFFVFLELFVQHNRVVDEIHEELERQKLDNQGVQE